MPWRPQVNTRVLMYFRHLHNIGPQNVQAISMKLS